MVVALVAMGAGFTSCSDDDDETGAGGGPITPSADVEVVSTDAATSAQIYVELNKISEVAYKAVKAAEDTLSAGVMASELVFAEADAVVAAQDGKDTITVTGLEGNTTYNVYVAVKTVDNEYLAENAEMYTVTTANYGDQIVTMISTTPFSVKFHVNMPDTTNWILSFGELAQYNQMKMYFGSTDADYLSNIGNTHYVGPQTIEIKDGDLWYREYDIDWATGEADSTSYYDYTYTVKPGTGCVMLISAAYYGEVPYSWPTTYRWMPDYTYEMPEGEYPGWGPLSNEMTLGEYTEVCTDEGVTFNREYAKQVVYTAPAAVPADTVEVKLVKTTERTAVFEIVPSEECLSYHVMPCTASDYEMLIDFAGEAGIQAFVLNNGEPYADAAEYRMENLEVGLEYHLLVTGLYEETGAVQSFSHIVFTPQESTLPVPELTVTAASELNTHDMVYFNIKAPNGDAVAVKHLANYVKAWIPEINSGYSYTDLVEMYGGYFSEEDLAAINSAEGLTLSFASFEESDTRLAVISYNEEEKASDAYTVDSRSTSIPAKAKVESKLFEELAGEWTLNYYDTKNYYEKNQWRQFNSVITTNPDFGPATFAEWKNQDSYQVVAAAFDYDEAKCEELFNEYKKVAKHYEDKYAGQNQLLAMNFPMGMYTKAANQNLFTPWDLFVSEYYSAYDCAQLFYDFGPKVMFEVVGENEMVLKSDIMNMAPLANFDSEYYFVGVGPDGYLFDCQFPVTVSENKDSIIVHPVDTLGAKYYPSVVLNYGGGYIATQNSTDTVMVYTKGALAGAAKLSAVKPYSVDEVIKANKSVYNQGGELMPAKLAKAAKLHKKLSVMPKLNRVEGKLFDLNAHLQSLKK